MESLDYCWRGVLLCTELSVYIYNADHFLIRILFFKQFGLSQSLFLFSFRVRIISSDDVNLDFMQDLLFKRYFFIFEFIVLQ
jgi:hypothetical protein